MRVGILFSIHDARARLEELRGSSKSNQDCSASTPCISTLGQALMVTLIVALSLSACGSSAAKSVTVGEQDANSTVSLNVSDTLEVVLDGNPTTGYQWEKEAGNEAIVKQVGEAEFKADSDALGSGGKVTLRFEAVGAGQTVLRLIYQRSFEPDAPPLKTFEVTVTVK